MRTRQFGGMLILAVFFTACAIGYSLNDGTPSVPWGIAGAAVGLLLTFLIRRTGGR
ncbi:hypothetical protein [Streptomyces sp. NPDC093094]|uniref:hypothetical protein n=1 Tax=Streptomyces sp. NPDC093094 TaxID=3366026 RepID=UPI0038258432